MKNKKNEKI